MYYVTTKDTLSLLKLGFYMREFMWVLTTKQRYRCTAVTKTLSVDFHVIRIIDLSMEHMYTSINEVTTRSMPI